MAKFNFLTKEDLKENLTEFKKEFLNEISDLIKIQIGKNQADEYLTFKKIKERFSIESVNTLKKYIEPKSLGKLRLYSAKDIVNLIENPEIQKNYKKLTKCNQANLDKKLFNDER